MSLTFDVVIESYRKLLTENPGKALLISDGHSIAYLDGDYVAGAAMGLDGKP